MTSSIVASPPVASPLEKLARRFHRIIRYITDAQDKQDETLLHRKLTRSMIRGACEVIPKGLGANA